MWIQSGLDGSAGWADGVAPSENDATVIAASSPEGWSFLQKIGLFGFVVTAAVFYVRLRKSSSRDTVGFEKSIA